MCLLLCSRRSGGHGQDISFIGNVIDGNVIAASAVLATMPSSNAGISFGGSDSLNYDRRISIQGNSISNVIGAGISGAITPSSVAISTYTVGGSAGAYVATVTSGAPTGLVVNDYVHFFSTVSGGTDLVAQVTSIVSATQFVCRPNANTGMVNGTIAWNPQVSAAITDNKLFNCQGYIGTGSIYLSGMSGFIVANNVIERADRTFTLNGTARANVNPGIFTSDVQYAQIRGNMVRYLNDMGSGAQYAIWLDGDANQIQVANNQLVLNAQPASINCYGVVVNNTNTYASDIFLTNNSVIGATSPYYLRYPGNAGTTYRFGNSWDLAQVELASQTAGVSETQLLNTPGASTNYSDYILHYYMACVTQVANANVVLTAKFYDRQGTHTVPVATLSLASVANISQGSFVLQSQGALPISFSTAISGTSLGYNLSLRLQSI